MKTARVIGRMVGAFGLTFVAACSGAGASASGTARAAVTSPEFDACMQSLPSARVAVSGLDLQFSDPDYDTFAHGADGEVVDLGLNRLVVRAGEAFDISFFRFFRGTESALPAGLAVDAVFTQDGAEVLRQSLALDATLAGVTGKAQATLPSSVSGTLTIAFEETAADGTKRVVNDFVGNGPPLPFGVSDFGKPMFVEVAGASESILCLDRSFASATSQALVPGGTLSFAYDARRLLDQDAHPSAVEPRVHVTFFDVAGTVLAEKDLNIGSASASATHLYALPVPVPAGAHAARVFIEAADGHGGKVYDSDFGRGWLVLAAD